MKILIISDTHRDCSSLERVLPRLGKLDQVLHLGDFEGDDDYIRGLVSCPVAFVSGNCDLFSREPSERVLELAGHRILMTHGHKWRVRNGVTNLLYHAEEEDADIVLYGHLHVPHVSLEDGIWVMSPGSIAEPRQADRRRTCLLMTLEEGMDPQVELIDADEEPEE